MSSSEGKMNLEEYFQRIGFHGPHDKVDLASLKLIHKLHVMTIPFENLSMHCGEWVTMDLEDIFNKLERSSRGGWCLESNYLFGWVLREMGFKVTMLSSKVFNSVLNDFAPGEDHLIYLVEIDGKVYLADVSFGVSSQIWEPLELISGKDQPQGAGVFRLLNKGEIWILEKTCRKPVVVNPEFSSSSLVNKVQTFQIYCFTLEPRGVEHFKERSHFLQISPTSLFTNKSICCQQTPTGFKVLVGLIYSVVTYKPEEGVDILDMRYITEDELDKVLKEQLNVRLQKKLTPSNKKTCYKL
ncbi:hypothetical protein ILYODFUR_000203 [Ilyodon furcidens]|uniref:arylamine N-acetyltransferase n=1 Tax=Ilyodon furcidens TaxID=33524 RepID=A0ABV0T7B8_9TELE